MTIASDAGMTYEKSEVDAIAAAGFNFVRVPLDFLHLFGGTDTTHANPVYFESMDELVSWCAEAGIHVCFDLHDMPGFNTGKNDTTLFTNQETQALFTEFWRVMAEHYKDVPSNLLSFNLLNEPHSAIDGEPTDEVYSEVMKLAIRAIQEVSPDRLIFVDMLSVPENIPVEGLADEKVAQAFHPYLITGTGKMQWPANYINGFLSCLEGDLVLQGEFIAGTEIELYIGMAHQCTTLELVADGNVVNSHTLGDEALNENGCVEIGEEGTDGEWRRYRNKSLTFTVEQPVNELRIRQSDGQWYMLESLSVKNPELDVIISSNEYFVKGQKTPSLSIDSDGTVSSADSDTLFVLNAETLRAFYARYDEFRQRTGQDVMAQEFGCPAGVSNEIACQANDALLQALTELDIPWCVWCSDFGVLTMKAEAKYRQSGDSPIIREDATYVDIGDGWLINQEMMDVFSKYNMK